MSFQATINLRTLRCLAEGGLFWETQTEPYVWGFLAGIATTPGSFESTPDHALLAESRKVIKSSMKAGESAQLEFPGNLLSITFEDGQTSCNLVLVVALLEADENSMKHMQAGYQAYLNELRAQLGHNLLALQSAAPEEAEVILDDIKKAVSAKAFGAVKDSLSNFEKFKVLIGSMDPDDFVAASSAQFKDVETLTAQQDFTLHLENAADEPVRRIYEIDGSLNVARLEVDPCQSSVDGVRAAEQKIQSLHNQVRSLQQQLQTATPQQKPGIIQSIKNINEQQIPAAEEALVRAQRALRHCRLFGGTHGPIDDPVVRDVLG
jgi:hypothetical protein